MARHPFGGTPADYVIDASGRPIAGRDDGGNVVVFSRVYDAPSGNIITDLQYETGDPISDGLIVPGQDGRLPRFLADDGRGQVYVNFGGAGWFILLATDTPNRVAAIEALGTGSVGVGSGQATATATVYSSSFRSGRPATDAPNYTWTCDGTDDQAEINAAITAVATSGGGKVQLLGDVFSISGSIVMKTGVWLQGEGLGTGIEAGADFNVGMVTLADNTVHATKASDFALLGNSRPVPAGFHYVANGGQVFTSRPSTSPDPAHVIDNVFITKIGTASVAGHGMRLQGANLRAMKISKIRILAVTGCGIWIDGSVDSHYQDVEIGSSGSGGPTYSTSSTAPVGHGFFVSQGDNNSFVACKAWYSRGAGFFNRGARNSYVNCTGQDNYSYGFHFSFGKATVVGCIADSNGQAQGADSRGRAGFYLASESIAMTGCSSFDKDESGTAWQQQYGYQLSSGLIYSRVIGCTSYGNELGAVLGNAGTGTTVDIQGDAGGK